MSFLNININDLPEDENSFELIPDGWYSAIIEGAELKATKAGNGQYINLKLKIAGPSHGGRFVFSMINIQNQNPDAQRIGLGQLRSIMQALRLNAVQDTDQLIGGSLLIKVATREASGQYEAQNTVKAYKPLNKPMQQQTIAQPMPGYPSSAVEQEEIPF